MDTVSGVSASAQVAPWTATSAICEAGHVTQANVNSPDEERAVDAFCERCDGAVRSPWLQCVHRLSVNVLRGEKHRDTTFTARDCCAG